MDSNDLFSKKLVEVFYREAKGGLKLSQYQVRDKRRLLRHFILVFYAYTFILWHTLTEELRRHWALKPLNSFREALSCLYVSNRDEKIVGRASQQLEIKAAIFN